MNREKKAMLLCLIGHVVVSGCAESNSGEEEFGGARIIRISNESELRSLKFVDTTVVLSGSRMIAASIFDATSNDASKMLEFGNDLLHLELVRTECSLHVASRINEQKRLETLRLTKTSIDNQTLESILANTRLKSFGVTDEPNLNARSVEIISNVRTLEVLILRAPPIEVEEGDEVWPVPDCEMALRELWITGKQFDDSWLTLFTKGRKLETLYIQNTQVSDKGLAVLGKCTALRELMIDTSTISTKGLLPLAKLPRLEVITLRNTLVKNGEVTQVKSLFPRAKVYVGVSPSRSRQPVRPEK